MRDTERLSWTSLDTPLGDVILAWTEVGLRRLWFAGGDRAPDVPGDWDHHDEAAFSAGPQLAEYFAGRRTRFELPLDPVGTAFQNQVWSALLLIPYGHTRSYTALAAALDRPEATRAVGGANSRNPLPVVVPCHRVVGADGSLTGYAGGVRIKRFLLDLESGSRSLLAA